jgi:hypothetical protein
MDFVVTILTEKDGHLRDLAVMSVLIPYNCHHGKSSTPHSILKAFSTSAYQGRMLSLERCGDTLGCFAEMEIGRWGCGMIGRLEMIHQWYERRNLSSLDSSPCRVALLAALRFGGFTHTVGGIVYHCCSECVNEPLNRGSTHAYLKVTFASCLQAAGR